MRVSDWARAVPLPSNDRSGASTPTRLLLYRPRGHDRTVAAFPGEESRPGTVLTRSRLARRSALDELGHCTEVRASFSSSRLRKSRSIAPPSANVDFAAVWDRYILMALEPTGAVASLKDESEKWSGSRSRPTYT